MLSLKRCEIEEEEKWLEARKLIPFIQFPADWSIKIIPPFCGATARFWARRNTTPDKECVSIYLDMNDSLGCMGFPYWEVYPGDSTGDTQRAAMEETDALLALINTGLDYLEEQNK